MDCMGVNMANVPPSVVNAARRDQRYFREISSPDVRWIYHAMDEVLDPMEYEGSLLFDEYPDAGEVSRLTDQVLHMAWKQKSAPDQNYQVETKEDGGEVTEAETERGTAKAGNATSETEIEIADVGSGDADRKAESQKLMRELARALLCEEMCRRRFRHLMRRAGGSA